MSALVYRADVFLLRVVMKWSEKVTKTKMIQFLCIILKQKL